MKKASSKGRLKEVAIITVSLARALEQHSEQDTGKISLVQKAVSIIDIVPPRYHNVHTLYLSGNFISELGNLSQFKQVRVLSLSTNSISSIHELRCLSQLPRLENLNISGNPVTKHLLYRSTLWGGCKQLKILDNSTISVSQRHRLEVLLTAFEGRFEQLIHNFWTMEKMCRFGKNIDLHRHINRKTDCCQPDALDKYLRVCDLAQHYTCETKERLWNSLYQDCVLIYNEIPENQHHTHEDKFLQATEDLLERQQLKIQDLEGKLVNKMQLAHPSSQSSISDTDLFQEMESKILAQEKAQKCRNLYLMVNAFLSLKHQVGKSTNRRKSSPRKAKLKLNTDMGCQLINGCIQRIKKEAFHKLRRQAQLQYSCEDNVKRIIQKRVHGYFNRLKNQMEFSKQERYLSKEETIRNRRVRKELLQKYLSVWRDEYHKRLIENNTKEVCRLFQEVKARQRKYIQKTELLEEYVEVLKNQHYKELVQLKQSKATNRQESPRSRPFVRFDNTHSPQSEQRTDYRQVRQRSSPHTERLKTSHIESDALNTSNQYCLGSQQKENYQGTANAMKKTRQRVLNRKDSQTSTDQLQLRRQQIVNRLKQMSML